MDFALHNRQDNRHLYGADRVFALHPAPQPSILAKLMESLRILDLADRYEKGLLEDFRQRLNTQIMPQAITAIAGAA